MNLFQEFILKPAIELLTKKAHETEGVKGDLAKVENFVFTHLEEYLKTFTQATTQPTEYMHNNLDEINSMIKKSTGSEKPKANI